MRIIIIGLLAFGSLFLKAESASAFRPLVNESVKPYEITSVVDDFGEGVQYLGELKNDPQTYEITVSEEKWLKISLIQLKEKEITPFSLIVVKENNKGGGVEEVERIDGAKINWKAANYKTLGLKFLESDDMAVMIDAGTYRLEVSTPDNIGRYGLVFSEMGVSESYFKEVNNAFIFQKFFGKSIFSMLKSNYIYLPLGIIFIFLAFFLTWRWSKTKKV